MHVDLPQTKTDRPSKNHITRDVLHKKEVILAISVALQENSLFLSNINDIYSADL